MDLNEVPRHKCPGCGSESIRRSRRTAIDQVRCIAGYRPYRCRECDRRFHLPYRRRAAAAKPETRSESHKRRRAIRHREFFVYAIALIAFAIMAVFLTRERG